MRRSKEDSEQTRAAILDAAARMFCEKGYAATTVESIARAAGVTRGAFYWHFRDRSDVLGALHGRSFLPQERFLTAAIESGAEDPLGLEQMRLEQVLDRVGDLGDLFARPAP